MNCRKISFFILLLVFLLSAGNHALLSQSYPKDRIIDTVRCHSNKEQSYALFLPPEYDPAKTWPLIVIFDPSARGKTAVELFSIAGRKYGYVIACSNNSRNGPLANNFNAASAMLGDLRQRFTIDKQRIYTSGFSGGSRFAMALASTENSIAGVIGCGAGLPNDRTLFPSQRSDFLYYGLAGTRDMNYPEMHELLSFLGTRTHITAYMRFFEGGHQWPDQSLITEAVEWLSLMEIKRNFIPSDQGFINSLKTKTQNLINSELTSGNQTDAVMHMKFAIRDFSGTTFASDLEKTLSRTEESAEYKAALKEWNIIAADEQAKKDKYIDYLSGTVSSVTASDTAFQWMKEEAGRLVKQREKENPAKSRMASRLLNFISILCSEQGISFYRNRYYKQATLLFEICTISDSENPQNYYNYSRALAGSGRAKESTEALRLAVNHGFSSRKSIESDPVFGIIRDTEGYKSLIVRMK